MAYCTNCGKEIPDGVKFCSECGAQTNYSQKAVYENGSCAECKPLESKQDAKQKKIFTILGVISFILPFLSFLVGNPVATIIGWAIAIILALVALIKRCKLRGFPIATIVIVAVAVIGITIVAIIPSTKEKEGVKNEEVAAAEEEEEGVQIYTYEGISFDIPNYYSQDGKKFSYQGAIISFSANDKDISDEVFNSDEVNEKIDNHIQDTLEKNTSSIEEIATENTEIAGCVARQYRYNIMTDNTQGEAYICVINNTRDKKLIMVMYIVDNESKKLADDYDQIMQSAVLSDESNDEAEVSDVDPDLKAFLDEYEEFIDDYIVFMKKYYKNPSDITLLNEYADMLEEYSEFAEKVEAYDTESMSDEDLSYYLEVTTRCTQKLLKLTQDTDGE